MNELKLVEILNLINEQKWDKMKKKVHGYTGRGGRILLLEMLQGRELTQEEKDNIPEGMYSLDPLDNKVYKY